MGIDLLVVILTCCNESKTPTAIDSYYHVWRRRKVHGSPHDGALNVLLIQRRTVDVGDNGRTH